MTLRDNLEILRSEINQYTLDHRGYPQSLSVLIDTGYVKQLPLDPFTGRRDTWVPQFSDDPKQPGITNVRSGATAIDKRGISYSEW